MPEASPDPPDAVQELDRLVADAARFLPPQGPIDAFVAQNTLHGFEDLPFEEAVIRAARLFEAEPFLPESRYREELARGRIRTADIDAVLRSDLADRAGRPLAGGRTTLAALHRALLLHPVRQESDASVRWTLTESDAIERLRTDLDPAVRERLLARAATTGMQTGTDAERVVAGDLWVACVEAASGSRPAISHPRPPVRHRDLLLAVDPRCDTDELVHPLLIRLVAAYLDQGVASWPMPDRGRGMLAAVARLLGSGGGPLPAWSGDLSGRMREIDRDCGSGLPDRSVAIGVIAAELSRSGIPRVSWGDHVTRSLVALRGWAGMVHQLESRPDRAPVLRLPVRLVDFLALRLVLDRVAAAWALRRLGAATAPGRGGGIDLAAAWVELRDRHPPRRGPGSLARAFLLHQVSQLLGLTADDVRCLGDNDLVELQAAVASFDAVARRRIFHLAYERRHAVEVLDALAAHPPSPPPAGRRPDVQAVFCIDERCESFRRHLEEADPAIDTFGTAGFFAVPMYYRGIDDWHTTPLCPIVIRPSHTVTEVPEEDAVGRHRQRQSLRRIVARLRGGADSGSRTLVRGGLVTAIGGAFAAVPLVARVAFPRLTSVATSLAADLVRRGIPTRLDLRRTGDTPPLPDGTRAGFTVEEMAAIVRRLLEDIGLSSGLARIVAVIGHGSTSLNNPHESAYDCGACGGGRGGPNARAFALMANDPLVRARLAADGLEIPADTLVVAGMLDTCTSGIRWFEAGRVPPSHAADVAAFRAACHRVGALDARERCRRFDSVPLDVSAADALRRVEGRAADLAQVRAEYGHASNAVCIVGRRELTRGLYLDRRAFLVSYDPATDGDGAILERTLAAVGPVCGGINLAYLFSRVDPVGYGAGTKLPHNVTGLIGVMDGHASDLRTGLPLQGVEIHEPVRLLLVIDAPPERIRTALARLPAVRRLVEHEWIRTVARDPVTGALFVHGRDAAGPAFTAYEPEHPTLPTAPDSTSWYRGRRDNVPPARILAALAPCVPAESAR